MYKTTIKAFLLCALVSFSATAQKGDGARASIAGSQWERGGFFEGYTPQQELLGKRSQNAKHFLNANGSVTTQIAGKMHYRDGNGAWQEVNPAIEKLQMSPGYAYGNISNDIKSYFPAEAGTKPVQMNFNGTQSLKWWNNPTMSITANGTVISSRKIDKGTAVLNDNVIRYNNAYPGISEEFEVIPAGLENNTIIHAMTPELSALPANAMMEFSQVISIEQGWKVVANGQEQTGSFKAKNFSITIPGFDDGLSFSNIVIFDNTLTKEQAMLLAYAPEAKLTAAQKLQLRDHVLVVDYDAEMTAQGLKITTKLPSQWLKAAGRTFPVTIDPTATIGPIDTGNFYGPMTHWYGFQRHADLYLQSEIAAYGSISAIEYYKTNTAAERTKPTKVFMRTTSATALTGTAEWNSTTYTGGLAPLFDGMTTQDNVPGWKMITLTTPFNYDANNLLVMVYDEYGGSGAAQYMAQATVTGRQAFKRVDGTDPGDATTTAVEDRLQSIRITYTSDPNACASPSMASATVTSATTATINWTSTVANSEIVVQLAGAGAPAVTDGAGTDVIGATSYDATGLLAQTAYEFYVRSECTAGTDFSPWSGPFLFNTTMIPGCATDPTPANGAIDIPVGNVTFSWTAPTAGDPAVSYNLYYGLTPGNANILIANYTTTTAAITLTGYNTTFYWKIVPVNAGGSNTTCGEWSFTTVAPPPAPANDECTTAVVLTPGGVFANNPIVGTNTSATASTGSPAPGCASFLGGDVWYSVVVPPSGNITIETNSNTGGVITDTGMALYSGPCETLTLINCDDDSSEDGNFSKIALTGRTPGEVIYARVWEYGNNAFGTFQISAYDASLGTLNFDNGAFKFYPNPVSDVLRVSYSESMDTIIVFNLLGQQVASKAIGATTAEIDLSQLASGAYLVRVTSGNQIKTIKVLKN